MENPWSEDLFQDLDVLESDPLLNAEEEEEVKQEPLFQEEVKSDSWVTESPP